jgi:predicted PurR-regulated permease PerM
MSQISGTPSSGSKTRRSVRFDVSVGSIVLALIAIGVAFEAAYFVSSARRILSWVIACAVVAALIELAVQWLTKYVRRAVAIVLVLLTIAAAAGILVFGVFHDLDREVNRLQEIAPVAAHDIENSKRFGKIASEVQFEERVQDAVDRLRSPASGLAGRAVSSFGAYLVCAILTILFLSWGPKLARGGLSQLDQRRRHNVELIGALAFSRARNYVSLALMQSIVLGFLGFLACLWADLPAAVALALWLAVSTLIPAIGIVLGSLPIILLAGGLSDATTTSALIVFFICLQVGANLTVQPQIERAADLYVGPAIITIAFLLGFELYGIGGAMYAAALFVLGTAMVDASGEVLRSEVSETDRRIRDDVDHDMDAVLPETAAADLQLPGANE